MTAYEPHPTLETIQRYCDGSLPDFEQVALESHLAECEECMVVISRMDSLLETGFSAAAHAAALEEEQRAADPLVQAIRQAASIHRHFAASLRVWLGEASTLWGDAPVRHLGQAGLLPVSGIAGSEPIRVSLLSGEFRALIVVRESHQTVEVASDAPAGAMALLFLTGEEPSVRAAALEPVGNVRIARFEQVPPGSYRLAIGPAGKISS